MPTQFLLLNMTSISLLEVFFCSIRQIELYVIGRIVIYPEKNVIHLFIKESLSGWDIFIILRKKLRQIEITKHPFGATCSFFKCKVIKYE